MRWMDPEAGEKHELFGETDLGDAQDLLREVRKLDPNASISWVNGKKVDTEML